MTKRTKSSGAMLDARSKPTVVAASAPVAAAVATDHRPWPKPDRNFPAIPDFMIRSNDPKVKAKEAAAWDKYFAKQAKETAERLGTTEGAKAAWLPKSADADTIAMMEKMEAEAKERKRLRNQAKPKKIDPRSLEGMRWDSMKNRFVEDKFAKREDKAAAVGLVSSKPIVKKPSVKGIRQIIPLTGILAEFDCRPDTFRAKALLHLEKNMGKMLKADAISEIVYGTKEKVAALPMVLRGAEMTITKKTLPYEIRSKDKEQFGLFKKGAPAAKAEPKAKAELKVKPKAKAKAKKKGK